MSETSAFLIFVGLLFVAWLEDSLSMNKTHLPLRQKRNAPGGVQLTLCGLAVDCHFTPWDWRGMVDVTCLNCRRRAAAMSLAEWLFTPEPGSS